MRVSYEIIQGLKQQKTPHREHGEPGPTTGADAAVPMDDPLMATIAQVQQVALQGHREQAAAAYEQLWTRSSTVAHCTASRSRTIWPICRTTRPRESRWDERALEAAAEVTPHDADAASVAPLRASLHINAASALHKLGRQEHARQQLEAARQAEQTLPEDGYGRLVRSQIDMLGAEMNGQQTLL